MTEGMLEQVPFRRVHLTENNGHFDLYDTSGPQVNGLARQCVTTCRVLEFTLFSSPVIWDFIHPAAGPIAPLQSIACAEGCFHLLQP